MSGTPSGLTPLRPSTSRARRPILVAAWVLAGVLAAATACKTDSPSSPLLLRLDGEGGETKPPTLTLTPKAVTLAIGDSASLEAQGISPTGAQAGPLQWSSSHPLVASVDTKGKVKALTTGVATISVSVLGLTERATVTVTPPPPGTVSDLAVVSTTESAVSLGWTQVADGTGAPARYAVRYAPTPLDWRSAEQTEVSVAPTGVGQPLGYTVTGLEADTDYEFQVIAYRGTLGADAVGGPLSNKVRTRTQVVPAGDRLLSKGGDLQSGPVGSALPIPLVVQVLAKGEPKTGSTVVWSVASGDGVVRTTSSTTDTEGRAQTIWVLGNRPGAQTVRAVLSGVGEVLFTATARPGPVASVTVSPQSVSGPVDRTHQLSAAARDVFGNLVPDAVFTWSTTNPVIVTVDSVGRATGKTVGNAEVHATSAGAKGIVRVKVDPTEVVGVSDLQVIGTTETSVTLAWSRLQLTGSPAGYALRYGSPTITWANASPTQVSVAQSGSATLQYTFTGLQPGTPYQFQLAGYTGTLGADAVFGPLSNVVGTATRSAAPPVLDVDVTPARHTFTAIGQRLPLTTAVRDGAGAVVTGTKLTSFSTNTSVATVDTMGTITAHGIGVALIVVGAACCSASDTAQVTVSQTPAFVELAPSSVALMVGETEQLGVVVRDANRNPIVGAPVTWSSQSTAVASVTQGGLVRGVGAGTTLIEAVAGSARASASVAVTAGVPGLVTDLQVPGRTQTSLTVEWTEVSDGVGKPARYFLVYGTPGQPNVLMSFAGSAIGAKTSKTLTGLTADTDYQLGVRAFRVIGADTVMGPDWTLAQASTQGAPGGTQAIFSDGFESGGLAQSAGGFRWTDPVNAEVVTGVGRDGGRGVRFRYGPDAADADSWAELNFIMPALQQVWFEYWVKIPTNYEHRTQNPDNNKWWLLTDRKEGYNVRAVLESWRGSLDRARPMWGTNADKGGLPSSEWDMATPDGLVAPSDRGNWVHLRFQIKVADPGQANGVWRMWKNGVRMINETALPNAPVDRVSKFFREGYLMGWSNSGFNQRTDIILDDFRIYAANPGW